MKKQFENQLDMFLVLKSFFNTNVADYTGYIPLIEAVENLNNAITNIFQLNGKTLRKRALNTETKADRKKTLADVLIYYNACLSPWFMHNHDPSAPMETRLSPSAIKYATDARLLLIAIKTFDYVQSNLIALAAYGFSPELQTQLQHAITDYEEISDMPDRERDNRKKDLILLADAIESTRKLVREDITRYMGIYYISNPSFYGLFQILAKLGKPGNQTMALRVKVQNKEGKPIAGCSILVEPSSKVNKLRQAITKSSGQVRFQNLPNGLCTITTSTPNGEIQQREETIKSTERTDVVFEF